MPIDRGVHTKSYGTVPDNSILLYRAKEDSCLYLFILCIRCVKFFTEILMAIKASMILDNKPNTLGSTELLSSITFLYFKVSPFVFLFEPMG